MKTNQNTTALILMLASVLLLATSQYFWLRSEYKEHKRAFYSNADLMLKETVRTIEDSLVSRALSQSLFTVVANDLNPPRRRITVQHAVPVPGIPVRTAPPLADDTLLEGNHVQVRYIDIDTSRSEALSDSGVVRLILRSQQQSDSITHLKRLLAQIPRMEMPDHEERDDGRQNQQQRRRLSFSSAPLDSVVLKYKRRTQAMGYTVAFEVCKDSIPFDTTIQGYRRNIRSYSQMQRRLRTAEDSVVVNGVAMLNPESISSFSMIPTVIFKAYPQNLDSYLLGKLRNNIVFSVFILIITSLTFWLIFRNLRKQSRLNALKNDLISNVTHELKTPLATLSVALEALQQFGGNTNPETTREYLGISQNEVSRLSMMVDNILKTSLLEKQGVTLFPTEVDMEDLCAMVVKSWQPRFVQMGGAIDFTVKGEGFIMEADELQLNSVLNNLIDNAYKYSGESPHVALLLEGTTNAITVQLKDNGIGIPREYQSQVFEKFFRVPTGDRHNVKGYGLGLNYVKHIMDLHQGVVSLDSSSAGTTFMLTFRRKL